MKKTNFNLILLFCSYLALNVYADMNWCKGRDLIAKGQSCYCIPEKDWISHSQWEQGRCQRKEIIPVGIELEKLCRPNSIILNNTIGQFMNYITSYYNRKSSEYTSECEFENDIEVTQYLNGTGLPLLSGKWKNFLREANPNIINIKTFLKGYNPKTGYLVGTNLRDTLDIYSEVLGLENWKQTYPYYWGYNPLVWPENHVEQYLTRIINSGRKVVFILSPDMIHSFSKITRAEIMWLMDNPEYAKRVQFIVGGYDLIGSESYLDKVKSPTYSDRKSINKDIIKEIRNNYLATF